MVTAATTPAALGIALAAGFAALVLLALVVKFASDSAHYAADEERASYEDARQLPPPGPPPTEWPAEVLTTAAPPPTGRHARRAQPTARSQGPMALPTAHPHRVRHAKPTEDQAA
jgi:hypothetical protein